MKERRRDTEQARRNRTSVDRHIVLVEVKAAFAMHEKRQRTRLHPIALAALRILGAECALHRGLAIARRSDSVGKAMAAGVFIII